MGRDCLWWSAATVALTTCSAQFPVGSAENDEEAFQWDLPMAIAGGSVLLLCCAACVIALLKRSRTIRALHRAEQASHEDATVWSVMPIPGLIAPDAKEGLRKQSFEATSLPGRLSSSDGGTEGQTPYSGPYRHQINKVRYSCLLLDDAKQWIQDPRDASLSFSRSKQRGFMKVVFVVTMYAETPELLERTLKGIAHGVDQLVASGILRSWDEACICIVADGLAKLPSETASWFEEVGIYSPVLMRAAAELQGNDQDAPKVALHCFEGIMQFSGLCPSQTILLIKQENAGKLDSQRWAFNGIVERLFPNMPVEIRERAEARRDIQIGTQHAESKCCHKRRRLAPCADEIRALDRFLVTVDAGTEPKPGSIVNLLSPMRYDLRIAGTCGHMVPDRIGCSSLNPIVMSQVFEYEVGHILDKSMETMLGFISVLPGAFSAYRYDAIRREQWVNRTYQPVGPLVEYFRPLTEAQESPAVLNMGLAEDRILCFHLIAMPQQNHLLHYSKDAKAVTDVPDTLESLLQQRRRWNNGAFFAQLHALVHFRYIFTRTNHSWFSQVIFLFQAIIIMVQLLLTWFSIGLFYITTIFGCQSFTQDDLGEKFAEKIEVVLIVCVLAQLLAYYDRRMPGIKWLHYIIAFAYTACLGCSVGLFIASQEMDGSLLQLAALLMPFAIIILFSALHGKLLTVTVVLPAYFLLLPVYIVLGHLYGFCHLHDVSWGTKGIETAQQPLPTDGANKLNLKLAVFRFKMVFSLVASNAILVLGVRQFELHLYALYPITLAIVFIFIARSLGSLSFVVYHWLEMMLNWIVVPKPTGDYGEDYRRSQLSEAVKSRQERVEIEQI